MKRGLIVLLLLLVSCSAVTGNLRQTQRLEGLTITLTTPDQAQINRAVTFDVELSAAGSPIDDAAVYLDLDMPAMPMGVTRPVAEFRGNGRYQAVTAYTMSGHWEITVVVERPDGSTARATFTRTVREEE